MKTIKRFYTLAGGALCTALLAFAAASCSSDDSIIDETRWNEAGEQVYDLEFVAGYPTFDLTTRADEEAATWPEGATVYLRFKSGSSYITGKAQYTLATDTWSVTANGTPAEGSEVCEARYFENYSEGTMTVNFTDSTVVYEDAAGQYSYDNTKKKFVVTAVLKPKTSRIRFVGTPGSSFFVKGIRRYTAFNPSRNLFTETDSPLQLTTAAATTDTEETTDELTSTPYVYGVFADDEARSLTISDSKQAYRQTFGADVLKVGDSGYMNVPTATSLYGWQQLNPFAAISIPDSISSDRQDVIYEFLDQMVKVESNTFYFQRQYPTLTSPFYIMKTEVTQKLYRAVMGRNFTGYNNSIADNKPIYSWAGGYNTSAEYDENYNYVNVFSSFYSPGYSAYVARNLREFVAELNKLTGLHFDYPTEAEWEFAANSGVYYTYAGNNNIANVAYTSGSSYFEVQPVALKTANHLGIYDMTGNVSEVCYYIGTSFSSSLNVNPAWDGTNYVLRGGNNYECYSNALTYAAVNNRFSHYSTAPQYLYYGLRLVLRFLDV